MTIKTLSGICIKKNSPLEHWHPMLTKWLAIVKRYCNTMGGEDAPYIYTERANTGILASAAWQCGYIALEEFQSPKGFRNQRKTNGRIDLYLANENFEEVVEAKQSWISLGMSDGRQLKHATRKLNSAVKDAKASRAGDAGLNFTGVAFLSGYLSIKKADSLDSFIRNTVETFKNETFPIVAWCFPKEVRSLTNNRGEMLPGVILVASNELKGEIAGKK